MASELSLAPAVIEKDYVLGWLLAAIQTDPLLAEAWVFKGTWMATWMARFGDRQQPNGSRRQRRRSANSERRRSTRSGGT